MLPGRPDPKLKLHEGPYKVIPYNKAMEHFMSKETTTLNLLTSVTFDLLLTCNVVETALNWEASIPSYMM